MISRLLLACTTNRTGRYPKGVGVVGFKHAHFMLPLVAYRASIEIALTSRTCLFLIANRIAAKATQHGISRSHVFRCDEAVGNLFRAEKILHQRILLLSGRDVFVVMNWNQECPTVGAPYIIAELVLSCQLLEIGAIMTIHTIIIEFPQF